MTSFFVNSVYKGSIKMYGVINTAKNSTKKKRSNVIYNHVECSDVYSFLNTQRRSFRRKLFSDVWLSSEQEKQFHDKVMPKNKMLRYKNDEICEKRKHIRIFFKTWFVKLERLANPAFDCKSFHCTRKFRHHTNYASFHNPKYTKPCT